MSTPPVIGLTGATGQIGSRILDSLMDAGYPQIHCLSRRIPEQVETRPGVRWFQGDICDPLPLDTFMDQVDIVIHAAGLVSYRKRDRKSLEQINVQGTANLINLALDIGVKHFIHFSSSAILSQANSTGFLDETSIFQPGDVQRIYTNSKYEGELEVWRGMEEGMGVSILQPTIVLDPSGKGRSTRVFIDTVCQGNFGYPTGSHGFVDVRDVARAVHMLVERGPVNERILLSGENRSYREVQDQLAEAMGCLPARSALSENKARWINRFRSWFGGRGLSDAEVRIAYEKRSFDATRARDKYGLTFTPLLETIRDMASKNPCS